MRKTFQPTNQGANMKLKNKFNQNDVYADTFNQYEVRADGTIRNVGFVNITKNTVMADNIGQARAIARFEGLPKTKGGA
tara:strand:+ start:895 stop:1131 length:237 start_codon:yes stop_codon:yes gene_type:complete